MFCRKCGAALRDTDKFCSQCGAPAGETVDAREETLHQNQPDSSEAFLRQNQPDASGESMRLGQPVPVMPQERIIQFDEETQVPAEHSSQPRHHEKLYDEKLYDEKLYDEKLYRDSFLDKKEEKSHALLTTITVLLVIAVLTVGILIIYFFLNRNQAVPQLSPEDEIQIIADGNQSAQGAAVEEQNGVLAESESSGSGQADILLDPAAAGDTVQAGGTKAENAAESDGTEAMVTEAETEAVASGARIDTKQVEQIFASESSASRYGIYIFDLKNSQEYAAGNYEEAMYASALISVPILYTAAVRLDQGTITLNDSITYVNSIGGRGEAYPEEKDGKSYPLSYYLTTMMTYSDNNCMNCLIDYLGLDVINTTCQNAGFTSVDLQRKIVAEVTDGKDNYISAKDLAAMVRELYRGTYQTIGREFIRQYFKIDAGDGYRTVLGMASDLPADALFLNQNGKGDTRYNEVAAIADDSCEYIISVMCSGDSGFGYETAISDISNYVYQSLN